MNGIAWFMPPVLTSSSVPPIADGRPARMLAKMIIEMPLPMPRSVICSPSHIRNIVPVTSVIAAVSTKPVPGIQDDALRLQRARGRDGLERRQHDRGVARVLRDLAAAGLAFLAQLLRAPGSRACPSAK